MQPPDSQPEAAPAPAAVRRRGIAPATTGSAADGDGGLGAAGPPAAGPRARARAPKDGPVSSGAGRAAPGWAR